MINYVSPDNLKESLKTFKNTFIDVLSPHKLKNSVTLTTNTTTITTGVTYNPNKNILMVFVNGLYIEETLDYTISEDNTSITVLKEITASSESPVIVRFIVIKL